MAITFPISSEFIALTKDGVPFSAAIRNEEPGGTDIVGTTEFPAIYFAVKDGYVFFRYRLRESPLGVGGFAQYAWVILFDTDSNLADSYEWELALRGVPDDIVLIKNTVKNFPSPGWGDQAEGTPIVFPIVSFDTARAVIANSMLGGVQNYFLDIAMNEATLKSTLGISDDTPLRFRYFTSANEVNFNKDRICDGFDECFTDFISLSTLLSGQVINKEDGSGISDADVKIYKDGSLVSSTTTDASGNYTFSTLTAGDYVVKISKCCFKPNCYCNTISVESNKNNIFNFALSYDCVCTIKCEISEIENEVIEEKERIYNKIVDFFLTTTPDNDTLSRYLTILSVLEDSTAELDCCISKILQELILCEESDDNG